MILGVDMRRSKEAPKMTTVAGTVTLRLCSGSATLGDTSRALANAVRTFCKCFANACATILVASWTLGPRYLKRTFLLHVLAIVKLCGHVNATKVKRSNHDYCVFTLLEHLSQRSSKHMSGMNLLAVLLSNLGPEKQPALMGRRWIKAFSTRRTAARLQS